MDIAQLGISVDSTQVKGAISDLEKLAAVSKMAETASAGFSQAFKKVDDSTKGTASATNGVTEAFNKLGHTAYSTNMSMGNFSKAFDKIDKSTAGAANSANGISNAFNKLGSTTYSTNMWLGNFSKTIDKTEKEAKELEKALDGVERETNQVSKATGNAAANTGRFGDSMDRTASRVGGLGASVGAILRPLAAFLSVREVYNAAEAWTTLTNRMRLVSSSSEDMAERMSDVYSIAQNARQPLKATGELYQRLAQSTEHMGVSSERVAGIVDTISKSLAVSGASAQSAEAALIQFGQAVAAGELRGQELNSVLEQAPALAKAIADGMRTNVGNLRQMSQEGKLTVEDLLTSIERSGDSVDAQFEKISATISQSLVTLRNSFTRLIGDLDTATGASSGLADAILALSSAFDSGSFMDNTVALLHNFSAASGMASEKISGFSTAAQSAFSGIGKYFGPAYDMLMQGIRDIPISVAALLKQSAETLMAYAKTVLTVAKGIKDGIKAVFSDDTIAATIQRTWDGLQTVASDFETNSKKTREEYKNLSQSATDLIKKREQEREAEKKLREERKAAIAEARKQATENGPDSENEKLSFNVNTAREELNALVSSAKRGAKEITDEWKKEIQALERLEGLEESLLGEEEKIKASYDRRRQIVEDARASLSDSRYNGIMEKIDADESREFGLIGLEKGQKDIDTLVEYARKRAGEYNESQADKIRLTNEVEGIRNDMLDPYERITQQAEERKRVLEDARAAEVISFQEHEDLKTQIQQHAEDQRNALTRANMSLILGASAQLFGEMAGLAEQFKGKQSGIYKAMFAASKAFAIAESIVTIQQGIAGAFKLPWPANLAAAASVVSATGSIVSTIQGTQLKGQAHAGMTNIPSEGTYLLDKGERVLSPRQNSDLTNFLKGGGSGEKSNMNVQINNAPPGQHSVRQVDDRVIIDLAVQKVAAEIRRGGGNVAAAIEAQYGVNRANGAIR